MDGSRAGCAKMCKLLYVMPLSSACSEDLIEIKPLEHDCVIDGSRFINIMSSYRLGMKTYQPAMYDKIVSEVESLINTASSGRYGKGSFNFVRICNRYDINTTEWRRFDEITSVFAKDKNDIICTNSKH
jgi:hypothetical protein